MKNNKAVNYELIVDLNKKHNLIEAEGSFMRSGTVGNYKATMSEEILNKFELWMNEKFKDTGLNFSYQVKIDETN